MSSMGDAVTAAVLTALATTTVVELTVKPWLEGRSARIKAGMQARYSLASHATSILAACDRLEAAADVALGNMVTRKFELSSGELIDVTYTTAGRAETEAIRWREQIDIATKALVDGYEAGGSSVTWSALRGLLGEYAVTTRWVSLAALDDRHKIAYLRALTKPAQALFFSPWPPWLRGATSPKALEASRDQLASAITQIKEHNVLAIGSLEDFWDMRTRLAEQDEQAGQGADEDPVIGS